MLRVVRAEIEGIDLDAVKKQPPLQMGVQRLNFAGRKVAAGHARLVGNDDKEIARLPAAAQGLASTGEKNQIRRSDEIVLLHVNRAVTIEENRPLKG
jgi:hypothetical protein